MALTRAMLKGMQLTEEQVSAIIEEHSNTVQGLKDEIKKYKADAEKLPEVQKELDKLKEGDGNDWEKKYNKYLKTAEGYASTLKACTLLYDDGVRVFINLCNLKKAITGNPQGIVATMSMNNLYIETATELVSVYTTLRDAIAKGGKENMLTGAERSKTLWALNDRLDAFNKKLNQLYLSIRYYNMMDVWENATAGMLDRSNGEIAEAALGRWKRTSRIVRP